MKLEKGAGEEAREQRIRELLAELTLDEKIFMLSGHGFLEQIKGHICEDLGARDLVRWRDLGPTSYITSCDLQVEGRPDIP